MTGKYRDSKWIILTHHYYPKSIIYIRIHFWCYTFYRFGKYVIIHIHNYRCIQNNFTALKVFKVQSPNLAPLKFLLLFHNFAFPRMSYRWNHIQYIAFSNWLLYLITCISPPCFSWFDSSFPFSAKKYFIIWIYHSLFKCLPTEGYLLVASSYENYEQSC